MSWIKTFKNKEQEKNKYRNCISLLELYNSSTIKLMKGLLIIMMEIRAISI